MDRALRDEWARDPKGQTNRALDAIGDEIFDRLKERSELAAGGLAVLGDGAVLEEWASYMGVGLSEDHLVTLTPLPLYELLPPYTLELEKMPHVMSAVGPLIALEEKLSAILVKALRWYSRGRQERPGTVERFMGLFLALEALTALAKLDPSTPPDRRELAPVEKKRISLLRELANNHGTIGAQRFLESLVADFTKPSLVSRFRWLANDLSSRAPPDFNINVDADVDLFRKFKAIRDQLSHGTRSDVPFSLEGNQADNLLLAFVNRYLRALVLLIAASGQDMIEMDPPRVVQHPSKGDV